MNRFLSFWHDVRYIVLFYVVGDLLTTYIAITGGYGFESNPFLTSIYLTYMLKLIFLCWLSILYIKTVEMPSLWHFSRHTVAIIGVLATFSNLSVILTGTSLIQQVI